LDSSAALTAQVLILVFVLSRGSGAKASATRQVASR
jgi:hypothetical protein